MTAFLILILVLAVLFVAGLGLRAMHLVGLPSGPAAKQKQQPEGSPDGFDEFGDDYPEFPGFGEEYGAEPEPEAAPPDELVDLIDYFAEEDELEEEGEEEAPPAGDAPPEMDLAGDDEVEAVAYDRLCNLPTGRGFLIQCQNQLSLSAQSGQRYALICFDYDRFRFINSLKGFSIGDYALQKTAQEMRVVLPEGAMISRLSADHFMGLFAYSDEQQLTDYAEKLRHATDDIRADIGAKSGLKLSMGVALTDQNPESYDVMALLYQANIARHCLKITKGDDPYALFDPAMIDTFLFGESALEDYSENQYNDEFEVYFSPLYSPGAGRINASEALARWVYEDNNAEEPPTPDSGKLPTNNLKVIYQAFRAMSRWRREGNEVVPVLVNLTILELYKEDIDGFFARCLSEFQIEPKMVTVVVDIHTVGLHWPMAEKQLGKLRDAGMSIAVSGIERGLTTVDFLAGLPVRYVKMHHSISRELATRQDRQAAARALIQSAQGLNYETIFEGVDYSTAAAFLKQAGANLVQGGYAGLASGAEDFARNLQEHLKLKRNQNNATLVLDDETLAKGNFNVY